MTNGLLLVDKPQGITSHDVVARVRRIFNERKVGHAGTLDPMATGLLVLAIGPSTRLLRFAQSEVKRYSGTVCLGVATDSLDADGVVLATQPIPEISQTDMDAAAACAVGEQMQTPPMVSALKIGGQRLHELARRGVEVERVARAITINELRVVATDDAARWNFEVECSVGTYVRVLLSDLAERLGTIGHLVALRRVASGRHHVDDALTLDELSDRVARGESPVGAPRDFVRHLEDVQLDVTNERRMRDGKQLQFDEVFRGAEIAAIDDSGGLVGILARRGERWQPELVLPSLL